MVVRKLREGNRIIGTMIRMVRNPAIAQIAFYAGLDFIMFDLEHGPYSIETISDIAKVARSIGLGIFARVPELAKGYISRLMDAGVEGIMVPMISTPEEAQKLVKWSKYAPLGNRGFGSIGGLTNFNKIISGAANFMKEQNEKTLSIAQIETAEAIKNIELIAAVEGIDVLLVGPNDLAISLGVPGDIMGEKNQAAIRKVVEAAEKYKKFFAIHGNDALLESWDSKLQIIMNSLDISVLQNGFASIAQRYRR
ncbi:MAG: aldolase/citrate lyase family protein [Candidatus Caldatribacteriota bacterium]